MKLYQNKSWLKQKYLIEKKTTHKTAKEADCGVGTIWRWLRKFKIPIRTGSEVHRGDKNSQWKGGRAKNGLGYIRIYSPTHPYADNQNYVLEHRLVMETHLGRTLLPTEVVHHINGICGDNRIENLMLFSSSGEHVGYHKKRKKGEKQNEKNVD
jgi:hypothetical protein